MEEEKKKERWIVTYTKHMKQKRKVYHDGFLDLHLPTNKLMLYDESEKLLECRMLKKDEVVTSAETLTFASYFVDVGLLQFPSNLNSSDARRKSNEFRPINLSRSPSQKIIREFKKSELQKYGTQESAPTTTKAGVTVLGALFLSARKQNNPSFFVEVGTSLTLMFSFTLAFSENHSKPTSSLSDFHRAES